MNVNIREGNPNFARGGKIKGWDQILPLNHTSSFLFS